jgi:hypothetical protein
MGGLDFGSEAKGLGPLPTPCWNWECPLPGPSFDVEAAGSGFGKGLRFRKPPLAAVERKNQT